MPPGPMRDSATFAPPAPPISRGAAIQGKPPQEAGAQKTTGCDSRGTAIENKSAEDITGTKERRVKPEAISGSGYHRRIAEEAAFPVTAGDQL